MAGEFDPDAYLAQPTVQVNPPDPDPQAFDPDAYLSSAAETSAPAAPKPIDYGDELAPLLQPADLFATATDDQTVIQARAMTYAAANDKAAPEKRAQVLLYSAATGLAPDLIEAHLDDVKARVDAQATDWLEIARRQPALVSVVAGKPTLMPIVKEDHRQLGVVERALNWAFTDPQHIGDAPDEFDSEGNLVGGQRLAGAPARALSDAFADQAVIARQSLQAFGGGDQKFRQRTAELQGKFQGQDYGATNWVAKSIIAPLQFVPWMLGEAGAAAAGGLLAGPGGAAAAAAGWRYEQTIGPAHAKLSSIRDANGDPLDPVVVQAAAQTAAIASTALMGSFSKLMTGAAAKLAGQKAAQSAAEVLAAPTATAIAKKVLVNYGKTHLEGVALMGAIEGVNATAEEAAQATGAGGSFDVESAKRIATRTAEASVEAFKGLALLSALGPGREMIRDVGQAKESADRHAQLAQAVDGARTSKLLELAPDSFRDFVKKSAQGDDAIKAVLHPIEAWNSYWQEQKIDPAEMAAHVMGDDGKGYSGVPIGGNLAIPVEKWLTTFGAKTGAHADALLEIAKTRAEDSTPRQAKADQVKLDAAMEKEATSRKDEIDADKKTITNLILEQTDAAKLPRADVTETVKLMVSDFATMAVRLSVGGQNVSVREAAARGSLARLKFSGPDGATAADAVRQKLQAFLEPTDEEFLHQRLATMSGETRGREAYVDPNTGAPNARAFADLPPQQDKPIKAHFSVEGIKYGNDNIGHDKADLIYRAAAKALHEASPGTAKVDGDFGANVTDETQAQTIAAKANAALPEGLKGFKITVATGKTYRAAGKNHSAWKDAEIAAGNRANPRPMNGDLKLPPERPKGLTADVGAIDFPTQKVRADVHPDLQKNIAGLSNADYIDKVYRNPDTGAYTADGWFAFPRKAHVAALDVADLSKAVADYGEAHGDAIVNRVQRVAAALGGKDFRFSRLHGDEFAAEHDDRSKLDTFVLALQTALKQFPVMAMDPEGVEIAEVVRLHHGLGERSYEAADLDLNRRKDEARQARAAGGDLGFGEEARAAQGSVAGGRSRPGGSEPVEGRRGRGDSAGPEETRPHTVADYVAAADRREPRNREQMLAWGAYTQTDGSGPRPIIDPALRRALLAEWGPLAADPLGDHFDPTGVRLVEEGTGPRAQQGTGNGGHLWLAAHPDDAYRLTPEERLTVELGLDPALGGKKPTGYLQDKVVGHVEGAPVSLHQPAFHGSPHDFEKFSLHNIGTGEGNQSYGWGMYFAGRKDVAEGYRSRLSRGAFPTVKEGGLVLSKADVLAKYFRPGRVVSGYVGHDLVKAFTPGDGRRGWSVTVIASRANGTPLPGERTRTHYTEPKPEEIKKALVSEGLDVSNGQTFKVDVPADHELLDADAPLTEQSPKVLAAIKQAFKEIGGHGPAVIEGHDPAQLAKTFWQQDGAAAYRAISKALPDGPQGASEYLATLGVPGLRYLDGGSRDSGAGTHNYVIWDESRMPITEKLYAGDPNNPRGEIQLQLDPNGKPRAFNISILNGDKSTFLHETAHFLSWSLHDIATSDIATPELRKDYANLLKYAGFASPEARLENNLKHQTLSARTDLGPADLIYRRKLAAGEEKIAHAWEQYMLEGKAPSKALARVFSKFRGWMLRIYKGVAGIQSQYEKNYGQPLELSDEVRGIFDRMLADDEAIRQAQRDQGRPEGPDPIVTVMTAAEAQAHENLLADARAHAEQQLAQRAAELKNKETDITRAAIRTEVTRDTDAQPVYSAMRYLQRGELPDGAGGTLAELPATLRDSTGLPYKVNLEQFVAEYGVEVAHLMPPRMFSKVKDGGRSIEELAPLLGFNEGAGLVDALRKAEPRDRLIEKQTQDRLDAEYGPALQANAAAAMDAVHSDADAQATILKIRAMARDIDPEASRRARTIDLEALKATAARLVAGTKLSEIDPDRFAATERKLALQAAELWGAGKKEESKALVESKLFNQLRYRAERDAQDHLDKVHDRLEAIGDSIRAKLGLADPAYRDAHDALLEAVGLRDGKAPAGAIDALVEKAAADDAGLDFDVDGIRALIAAPIAWDELTVDQANAVDDAATNIRHVAKAALEVTIGGKKKERAEYLKEVFERVASVRPPQPKDAYSKTLATFREKGRKIRRGLQTTLENMETWASMMDGGAHGPFRELFVDGQRDARDREVVLNKTILDVIREKWANVPKEIRKLKNNEVNVKGMLPLPDEFNPVVSRDTLWMLFLNWGNEGNRQRIRDGNKWTDEGVQKALNLLSKPETDFLQGVLDAVGSLGPEVQAAHERRTGLKLNMVEAAPITVNGTTYPGGYFHLKYDSRGQASERINEGKDIRDMFASNYVKASTARGFTEKRLQKVNKAVDLSWGVVQAHLTQVVHDLSYGDWVRQAAGILLDKGSNVPGSERPSFTAVSEKFLGAQRHKELMPWLGDVANNRVDSAAGHQSEALQTFGRFAQGVVSRQIMGLNIASLSRHLFDPYSTIADSEAIFPLQVAAAYLKVINPANWNHPIYAASKALAHHESRMSDNMRTELGRIGSGNETLHKIDAVLFAAHGWVHHFTARVVYRAAYDQAIGWGAEPWEAAQRGDDVVERHLPSGDIAEKPPIMRQKNEIAAAAAVFYSYASKMHNLRARAFDDAWRMWGSASATPADKFYAQAVFAGKMIGLGAVSAMGLYLAGRALKKDDKEGSAEWTTKEVLLSPLDDIALVGPLAKKVLTGHKASIASSPGLTLILEAAEKAGKMLNESKSKNEQEKAWAAVEVLLSSTGPGNAVHKAVGAAKTDRPRNAADVAAGLLYGPKKNRSISPLTQLGDWIN